MLPARLLLHGTLLLIGLYHCQAGWVSNSHQPNPSNQYQQGGYHNNRGGSGYSGGYSGSRPHSGNHERNYRSRDQGYGSQGSHYTHPVKPRPQAASYGRSQPKSNSYLDAFNRNQHSYDASPHRSYSGNTHNYPPQKSKYGRPNQGSGHFSYSMSTHSRPNNHRSSYSNSRPSKPSHYSSGPSHPQPSYGGQSHTHRSPSYPNRNPSHSHSSPSHSHGSPSHSHGSPSHSHISPSHSHSSPSHSHRSPSHSHRSPSHSHQAPSYPPRRPRNPHGSSPSQGRPRYSSNSRHSRYGRPNSGSPRRRLTYRRSHRRNRITLPKPRNRNSFYQMHYKPHRQNSDFYQMKYPKIPKFDFSYSQDTSGYASQGTRKVACYQCNYRPGEPKWEIVKVRKSVPDPYNPFRHMSVEAEEYVRKDHVAGGWDKCQGNITPRSAKTHGIYSDASCHGNCYVRTETNGMVYRGCYAGEWAVNQHMYGCSYQAGALYCFCRGDRCNGFMAPATYTQPYPHSYGRRRTVPYPSDYTDTSSSYNPYPSLSRYQDKHDMRSSHSPRSRPHRYRRSTANDTENAIPDVDDNEANMVALMMTADRPEDKGKSAPSGKTDPYKAKRKCYQCSYGPGAAVEACKGPFTKPEATQLGLESDDCFGNCYVQITSSNEVIRGCYGGEMGVNQHLIGCHVQNNATYCFCRGDSCNRFTVTVEEADLELLEEDMELEEEGMELEDEGAGQGEDEETENEYNEDVAAEGTTSEVIPDDSETLEDEEEDEGYPIMLYYVQFPESE